MLGSVLLEPLPSMIAPAFPPEVPSADDLRTDHAPVRPLAGAGLRAAAFDDAVLAMAVLSGDGRWLLTNRAARRLLGYTVRELAAGSYPELLLAEERAADLRQLGELAAGTRPAGQVERQVRTKSGELRWMRISLARAREPDGRVVGVVASIEDIERSRDHDARASTSLGELKRSNGELELFASVAAHDLQEPLRKIRAFGDRLEQGFAPLLGERGRDYVHRMQASAERMQRLIDDLLAYARIATRGRAFELVDLEVIVRDVAADLETRIEQGGGRLRIGSLPTVAGDPGQMRQLFQNLLGNALKFADPDRPVVVDVGVAAGATAGSVAIAVRDNGIGFDPIHASRIFEPFERLHGRTEYEGTGIGLAISRRIAERHGGTITVESTPDQGSTFVLTLPLLLEEPPT